jgi:SAM-dependent methyltransferase
MNHDMHNSYEDIQRAAAYAELELPGTYALAYRDLPAIIARHVQGRKAFDFGCGTGRSTRFLANLGFNPVGVDIAPEMIDQARALDPGGDYRLIDDGDLARLPAGLQVAAVYRPLGRSDELHDWVNETRIPPWVIYVLEEA